ncbi:MAG: fimbrillin family protein [Bacteroidales bacterium]|nr:fimbrillin family protein [Bacteroidales bacterium]
MRFSIGQVKRLAALLLFGLLALSCSKGSATEEIEYQKQLSFSGYTARSVTKAGDTFVSTTELPGGKSFGVYAYNTGSSTTFVPANIGDYTVFMSNVAVTYNGSGASTPTNYTYSPLRYWPNTKESNRLAFFAYYPYGGAGITGFSGYGSFTFEVQTAAASQVDFMISDVEANQMYGSATGGTDIEKLKFYHMLTQVRFKGITDAPTGATVKINSLKLTGIVKKGVLAQAVSAASSTWTPESETDTYTITLKNINLPSNYSDATVEAADIAEANQTLLLLPQTLSSTAKMVVNYTITTTNPARTITEEKELPLNTAIPTWTRNQQIVYTLNIGLNPIEFTAQVVDWSGSDQIVIVN